MSYSACPNDITDFYELNKLPFIKNTTVFDKAVMGDKSLTSSAKHMIKGLFTFKKSCKSGKVWLSQKSIAEMIGCSVPTIRRSTEKLINSGWISIEKNEQTRTYNYTLNVCSQIKQEIQKLNHCLFKQRAQNDQQYRSHSSNLRSTSNIDLKENLNNKKEIICQEVLQEKCGMTDEELEKLPSSIKKSMMRIKSAIESKEKVHEPQNIERNGSLNQITEERQAIALPKEVNAAQAITGQIIEKRKYKYQPQELNLGFQQIWQIKRMAMNGIKSNPCDEYPNDGASLQERTDELAYRIEIKAREELRLGKARDIHESLTMSRALIERNQLTRYHGVKDEGAIHAEQQYIEHEKAKKEEISGFQSIMNKVGISNFKLGGQL